MRPDRVEEPAPANDDRKPAIVTARKPKRGNDDALELTPEELQRRGEAADALWRDWCARQPPRISRERAADLHCERKRHRLPLNLTGVMASRVVALVAERLVPCQSRRALCAGVQCRPLFHGEGQGGYRMQHARALQS